MQLLARSIALALVFLLGQFMLVGSGYACLGDEHAAAHVSAPDAAPVFALREAPDAHSGCSDGSRPAQCMLSGFSCSALGTCGVATMNGVASSSAAFVGHASALVVEPQAIAPTRSIAPELPPPRA